MNLLLFKIIALLFLFVFAFFISDFRTKKGMVLLVNKKLMFAIKVFYSVPMLIYIYVIINLENLFIYTYLGLSLTFIGAFLVAKAKIDLGKYHTWTGHILSSTRIITEGVYAFIRHPLYTGIYTFIIGAITIGVNNHSFSFYLLMIIIGVVFFIMTFLVITALRESAFLHEKFGEDFKEYKKQVHAFLPIRRYSFDEES